MKDSYNLQFEKLCSIIGLGEMCVIPKALSGGLLHKMFAVETNCGEYAIKALNPVIMKRAKAMMNIVDSENIADIAAKSITAIPANKYNGRAVQDVDGQYYLIYDYIEGISLKYSEIIPAHCTKMGQLLAELHNIDFSSLGLVDDYSSIETLVEWNVYLNQGIETAAPWVDILRENVDKLNRWNRQVIDSTKRLSSGTVISHGDLEPKNVIWNSSMPYVIDWEAAGFIHPAFDLVETAMYWANEGQEIINKQKFVAFINAYNTHKGKNPIRKSDLEYALQKSFSGKLHWLEYSLKRSLRIECTDEADQQIGTKHVLGTIASLNKHAGMLEIIKGWL